jgi:hypothetical protein
MKALLALILILCITADLRAEEIAGTWVAQDCGPNCGALVIHQHGKRVCGFWFEATTARQYEGRFVASFENGIISNAQVCGAPGSFTQSYCPPPSIYSTDPLLPYEKMGWEPSGKHWRLCEGILYEFDGVVPPTCGEMKERISRRSGLERITNTKSLYLPGRDSDEQTWVRGCIKQG